jgi:hypothetical protein
MKPSSRRICIFFKGLVANATLFIYFVFFRTFILKHIFTIHSSISIRRGLSQFFLTAGVLIGKKPQRSATPIEPEPTLQVTAGHRTTNELRCTHELHLSELRCTLYIFANALRKTFRHNRGLYALSLSYLRQLVLHRTHPTKTEL